ncbi:RrF2 family transcriptional regulator [Exiguobacterium flavidum]|uniref:RrF2 family transcriptional regulator n=1 Tax=Exiguobacterium flavidum TaxID=2184695 RepID=UPI000DF759E1|nr:Rrf2 family transcriptional regulator [Exiguobacterium flavidum]
MRMTRHTDYAIRTLLFASVHPDRLVRIQEVADCYGISKNHLTKVVYRLAQLGFISSQRGRGGGFRLAAPARDISIGQVVRTFEPANPLLRPKEGCEEPSLDPVRHAFDHALTAFHETLDPYSLEDLISETALKDALLVSR